MTFKGSCPNLLEEEDEPLSSLRGVLILAPHTLA